VEVDEEVVVVAEVTELISEEILDKTEVRGSEVGSEVLIVSGMEVLMDKLLIVSGMEVLIDKLLSKLFVVEEELLVMATDDVEDDSPVVVARLDAYVIV
jgi:hypothetical protein